MTGLARVTVTAAEVTAELVVPTAVPLAEIVPDLARSVGLLDAVTACSGYRVEAPPGHSLGLGTTLAGEGVGDGAVLVVRPGLSDLPASPYDDVLSLPRRRWLPRLVTPSVRRLGRPRRRADGSPGAVRRTSSARDAQAP